MKIREVAGPGTQKAASGPDCIRSGQHKVFASRGQEPDAVQDFDGPTFEAAYALQIMLEAVQGALELALDNGQFALAGTGVRDRFGHFVPNGVDRIEVDPPQPAGPRRAGGAAVPGCPAPGPARSRRQPHRSPIDCPHCQRKMGPGPALAVNRRRDFLVECERGRW